jgi:hypothetical protein
MNTDTARIDGESADLERDTDAIREDMNRTLDEIERKLSPGQLLDRSLGYLREHGSGIADAVGQTVRRNPLPVFMTTAGLLWMMTATYRSSQADAASRGSGDYGESDYPESAGGDYDTGSAASGRSSNASTGIEGIRAKASSGIESASNRVRNAEQAVGGRIREGATKAGDMARKTMQSTQQQTQRVQQSLRQMAEEQPLTLAAMGFAVGALLSAALPATEWEKRTLGQARERALSKAKELGEETYDELRDTLRGASAGSDSDRQREDGRELNH